MTVRVASSEGKSVRYPLGQGGLQTMVVRTNIVRNLVYPLQIREIGRKRTDSVCILLIDVAKTCQPRAVVADITNLQRKIGSKGMLDTEAPICNVWSC